MLPVLLDSLRGGWQANELARPLARLKAMDNNGLLRRTLQAWFRHNVQPLATSKALERHAPRDIVVALGVLWEDQIIYIWHSVPGSQATQALAGFHMLPAWRSVIGMSLLAAESDEALMKRFTPEQWQSLAPHVAQQREQGQVVWHHDDGEVSMARPVGAHQAALAFAGMWNPDEQTILDRLQQLNALSLRLLEKS
jgi:DNA-binding IclR family transcriptional regulator